MFSPRIFLFHLALWTIYAALLSLAGVKMVLGVEFLLLVVASSVIGVEVFRSK
jgi:UPF0716 family protein affecting phage T7 exclusion